MKNKALKPHHHINLNSEMKADLRTWLEFLSHPGIFSISFKDFDTKLTSKEIDMYTDASANPKLGCGGYSNTDWFILQWNEEFIQEHKPSINYLELYAVTIAVFNWIHKFQNKRIILFCDNMSVVHMINNNSSNCKNCMVLIRLIVLKGLIHNVKINAKHVEGVKNTYSDHLSRMKYGEFRKLARKYKKRFNNKPTAIPEEIWPMEKIWKKTTKQKRKKTDFSRSNDLHTNKRL